jgi:hypothetical protein
MKITKLTGQAIADREGRKKNIPKVNESRSPSIYFSLWLGAVSFSTLFVLAGFLFSSAVVYLNFLDFDQALPHIKEIGLNLLRVNGALTVLYTVSILHYLY